MTLSNPVDVARFRGMLQDLAHTIAHGIAGMTAFGVVRFLGRTLERMYAGRDVEIPVVTQLVVDVQSWLRAFWFLLPLLLVADFACLRWLRGRSPTHETAAGYSTGVMLLLVLVLGFATVMLVHPLAFGTAAPH
jgi:type II secretory pathway component PulF